jgi:oxygen-dependent protoporphyrinogen oxidase
MSQVRVIGAGLSGLATAWYLSAAGASVDVIEAAERPGGLLRTHQLREGLVESAARGFTSSERATALFAAAGVEACPTLPESRRRFIFRGGRPRRWPLSPGETIGAAARAASAWVRRDHRPHAGESVAAYGHRVIGPAATRWLIAPALQGIYATSPDVLSAAAIFGPSRGPGRGALIAPRGGMAELVDRLHAVLRARGVTFSFDTPVERLDGSVPTVICTNAPVAARLIAPFAPTLSTAIGRIRMVSLVVITAFFERRDDDWRGLGVLFPRSTGVEALGVLCNTDMFPDRGTLRSETWIYGDLSPAALPQADAIVSRMCEDRGRLTNRMDAPIAWHVTPQIDSLPVYDAAVLEAQASLADLPARIALAGNYLGRLGVSKLLDGAWEAARRITGERQSVAA